MASLGLIGLKEDKCIYSNNFIILCYFDFFSTIIQISLPHVPSCSLLYFPLIY